MSMSPFAPVAFLYLLLLLIVFSTPVLLQEDLQTKCPTCPVTANTPAPHSFTTSTEDTRPSPSVGRPTQADGGNGSLARPTQTAAPLSPGIPHGPVQEAQSPPSASGTPPETGSTVGSSSVATTKTNSTAATSLSQPEHTSESPADPSTPPPGTSATPSAGGATTSVGTATILKTTALSAAPSGPAPSPDQTSPSPAPPAATTAATTAPTGGSTPAEPVVSGTKVAVVEVAGAALTWQLVDTASLLAIVLFGLLFFLVSVAVFVTQAYESYRRKDYTQVDYLINGMYDSGV